jgi:hypothetical protein
MQVLTDDSSCIIFRNDALLLSERQGSWKILGRMTTNLSIRAQAPKPLSDQVQLSMAHRFFLMYHGTHRLQVTLRVCQLLNPLDPHPLRCTLKLSKSAKPQCGQSLLLYVMLLLWFTTVPYCHMSEMQVFCVYLTA